LQQQSFEHRADQIVLQEYVEAVRLAEERLGRIECASHEFLPGWSLAPIVEALQALRGVDLVVAVSFIVEIGDIRRFANPRRLMAIWAWCRKSGRREKRSRGPITKMGNAWLRQLLVESAWTYRHPPRIGSKELPKLQRVPPKVREIA
jgi:transposase